MNWRWDQGRLQYFRFDSIKRIAEALVTLEGAKLGGQDPLRALLTAETGLPFAPDHYTVWRNYARVFKCQLLATEQNGMLVCTDLCHLLADPTSEIVGFDDYASILIPRFSLPSPAFQGYKPEADLIFPFCVILKLLLSRTPRDGLVHLSLEELLTLGVANQFSGQESIEDYWGLRPKVFEGNQDQSRQVRELMIFLSQLSFLKWQNPCLFLDSENVTTELIREIEMLATPEHGQRARSSSDEILRLGSMVNLEIRPISQLNRIFDEDLTFTEGRKVRVTHLRTERSARLRSLFFQSIDPPYQCDMCETNVSSRYPWTENLLEVHHLLPLSSAIKVESLGTSIADLVGLCPTCHRATHVYYRQWLNDNNVHDFQDIKMAKSVYEDALNSIHL